MFRTFKIYTKTYGHTTFEQEFVLTLKIIANQNTVSNKFFVATRQFLSKSSKIALK